MDQAAYDRELKKLIREARRLPAEAVERAQALLNRARSNVVWAIADTEWSEHRLDEMKRAVADAMEAFGAQYRDLLSESSGRAWELGGRAEVDALNALGVAVAAPELSMTKLGIMQGYSADLVTNLTADARKRINVTLIDAILGEQTLNDTLTIIGKNLTSPSVFGTIATRAETIARTELARVQSAARQARQESIAERHKGKTYKQWLHSGKAHPRPHHIRLDGETVRFEDKFPGGIPYPHAPGLPAKEVVNCGCIHRIILPGMKESPS